MKIKLTSRALNRKPPDSGTLELWDTVTPGLALRIHAGGKRSYCVTTRVLGKQIRRTLGSTMTHSLAEARDEARKIIADAAKGLDSASKEARRQAARAMQLERERAMASSFRAAAEAYLADPGKLGGAKMKSRTVVAQRLEKHVMPAFGERAIGDIHRSEVRDLLRGMVAAGKPVAANRLLGSLKQIFRWAAENDKIETSPISDLEKPADEQGRDRVLTNSELLAIWQACGKLSKAHGGAIRMMMLTGARRTEVALLLRSEIVGNEWHLPAERSKNGRPHIWQLSELARDVIASVPQIDDSDPVFSPDGEKVVSGWSYTKKRLDKFIAEERDDGALAMPHWTLHDLRRSLVTGMVEHLGIAPHVVEAVVNHVSGTARAGVAGIYNRAVLLPQRREALEAWSRHIEALAAGRPKPASVTTLRTV